MGAVIRYISDLHFGHKSMATMRGFHDEFYHDEHIVEEWNKTVNKHDTTWILGDVTMEKANYEILNRLNGIKRVILGNHDMGNHAKSTLVNYVNSIHGMVKLRNKKYGNIWLTHCPVHPRELDFRVNLNIHGHVHKNNIDDKRYINVSAEVIDYKPKTIEELCKNL